jgi:hypothetical protein
MIGIENKENICCQGLIYTAMASTDISTGNEEPPPPEERHPGRILQAPYNDIFELC